MTSLHCPNGCGPLGAYLAHVKNRPHSRPFAGCRACGWTDWAGGNVRVHDACVEGMPIIDPPVDYEVVDSLSDGSDGL